MKVSRTLLETICNYKHAASKDETSLYLNTVALRRQGGGMELTSCDGYVAVKSLHQCGDLTIPDDNVYYLIRTDDSSIQKIELLLKEYKNMPSFNIILDPRYISILREDIVLISIELLDREYPNSLDNLFPDKTCPTESIIFNVDFMTAIRKAIYGSRKGTTRPKFTVKLNGNLKPMSITAKNNGIDHTALLVPLKGETKVNQHPRHT